MWSDVVRGELSMFTVANEASGVLETPIDMPLYSDWGHFIDSW